MDMAVDKFHKFFSALDIHCGLEVEFDWWKCRRLWSNAR
jgi:hypothetical protein